ncbi:hypothetical protein LEP1GSC151_1895 [Leptospira interrogans serovar Grippotyphosa str. LT2186]|uniref:Uncharacterized protein n=1 Tax=Leptospira interrogans serovar Grippotyphosa str. LT2186 TaxID=1001599 RepID=M3HCN2_LEPIR|nr:hypothetical protein LEP1GSC151_1895 [Leptospira interrogans serovar Grippotyphosa str. LT2186]
MSFNVFRILEFQTITVEEGGFFLHLLNIKSFLFFQNSI